MTKFNKNKLLILGAVISVCAITYADNDEFYPEIKNTDTVSYLDESEKEANDNIYIEFVDEKDELPAKNNVEKFKMTNLKKKNKKLITINILLLSRIVMEIWQIISKDLTMNTSFLAKFLI